MNQRQVQVRPRVAGIGTASFFADVGHEIPPALLPSLLTGTLGAPSSTLGLIGGVSDGLAGAARLGGGALGDDPPVTVVAVPSREPVSELGRLTAVRLLPLLLVAGLAIGCSSGDPDSTEAVRSTSAPEAPTTSTSTGAPAPLNSAEWTEHWDCGHSFTAANPEGTQQLVVEPDAGATVANPSTVELPSSEWRAHVQFGENFGARWFTEDHACTDVGGGQGPEPRIDEDWEVVGGTLTIEPEPLVELPGTASLTAEGLVVELPDGGQVTLDPISVVSECWGCFAG